ncbi:MAG: ParB N-terminal domain-containing protein [Pseudomonadales bacterium]|jgi:hypothetical protein|nr:ParB N-terminal domain-containing protein [Candidatus Thalassarchaeaceae archaeon]MDP7356841.1 ParB N-terminal domain-containing protein [Pseudomonadales bacterium]MDP7635918.1 ParB N-terminal domain-containing protein [Phycisphaerae bacterium]|tara:strand:- start:2128 stop:2913 length:786 start_codon:yes stop_codon:yes gene_type:complete
MKHNVNEALNDLLVPLDSLAPLEYNPRVGNVPAIMASYEEFGQVKPIVVRPNDDGTSTVVAGNHQVEAVKRLGWTHIAAVPISADDKRAVAFALADNRTVELGYTDPVQASDMIIEIVDEYSDLMESLKWDDFEIAYYEEQSKKGKSDNGDEVGFITPALTEVVGAAAEMLAGMVREGEDGERQIVADDSMDHGDVAVQGSTALVPGAAPRAVVQYTIVFDDPDQQKRWYDFVRWLRNNPGYDGATTGQKILSFIDSHSEP